MNERYLLRGEYEELRDRESALLTEFKNLHQGILDALYRIADLSNAYDPQEDVTLVEEMIKKLGELKAEYIKLKSRLEYLRKRLNL